MRGSDISESDIRKHSDARSPGTRVALVASLTTYHFLECRKRRLRAAMSPVLSRWRPLLECRTSHEGTDPVLSGVLKVSSPSAGPRDPARESVSAEVVEVQIKRP